MPMPSTAIIVFLLVFLSCFSKAEATVVRVDFSGVIGSAPTDTGLTGTGATGFIQYDTSVPSASTTYLNAITAASFTLGGAYTVTLGAGENKIFVSDNPAGDSISLSGPVAGPDLVGSTPSIYVPHTMRLDLGGPASVLATGDLPTNFSPITTSRELQIAFNGGGQLISALMDTVSFSVINTTVPAPAALPQFATGLALLGFIGWRRKRSPAV